MIEERKLGGFSLFNLWAGAGISLAEIMTGTLIAPLGIAKGILVILVGHIIGCLLLALIGVIGFREKKPSLISSRISLGKYGSYLVSIFNIIQLIGWTAIMLIQCSNSVQAITDKLFGINNFTLIVIITGLLVALWALYADKGVNFINNIAVLLLLILSFVMLGAILKVGHIKQITDTISIGSALEFSIIMPLSWVPLISDYTMAAKSAKGSFYGSFLGYFIGSSFMFIIGLISAYYTGNSDPISILNQLNMGYPALLIVILATVTTTFLDVYSAVMSTLNLTTKLTKKNLIIIFTALGTLLALIFPMGQYQNFLYIIGSLFAPVFSVILIDYFIYKADRSTQLVNVSGIIASVIGTFSYYIIINQNLLIGSTIPSMIITMLLYVVIRTITKRNKLEDEKYVKQNS
jgi:putative hydroxymethylpyrimidine transporter CytX